MIKVKRYFKRLWLALWGKDYPRNSVVFNVQASSFDDLVTEARKLEFQINYSDEYGTPAAPPRNHRI
jgi:hypothetical protein